MEKTVIVGMIAVVLVVIMGVLILKTREHYDGSLPIWDWKSLDKKKDQNRNKCIMKPGKYFTPGL